MPRAAASSHRPPSPTEPPTTDRTATTSSRPGQPRPSTRAALRGRVQPVEHAVQVVVVVRGDDQQQEARGGARPGAGQQSGEREHAGVLPGAEQRRPHPEEPLPPVRPARDPPADAVGQQGAAVHLRQDDLPLPVGDRLRRPTTAPAGCGRPTCTASDPVPRTSSVTSAPTGRPTAASSEITSQRSPMPRCSTFFSQVTAGRPALLRLLSSIARAARSSPTARRAGSSGSSSAARTTSASRRSLTAVNV